MPTEPLAALLGEDDLPGSPEELAVLSTRIDELIRLNGREWVIRHRRQLLREWAFIVDRALIHGA